MKECDFESKREIFRLLYGDKNEKKRAGSESNAV